MELSLQMRSLIYVSMKTEDGFNGKKVLDDRNGKIIMRQICN